MAIAILLICSHFLLVVKLWILMSSTVSIDLEWWFLKSFVLFIIFEWSFLLTVLLFLVYVLKQLAIFLNVFQNVRSFVFLTGFVLDLFVIFADEHLEIFLHIQFLFIVIIVITISFQQRLCSTLPLQHFTTLQSTTLLSSLPIHFLPLLPQRRCILLIACSFLSFLLRLTINLCLFLNVLYYFVRLLSVHLNEMVCYLIF